MHSRMPKSKVLTTVIKASNLKTTKKKMFSQIFSAKFSQSQHHKNRGNYKVLEECDLRTFKEILGDDGVLSKGSSDIERFNIDWLKNFKGNSSTVLMPKTTEQISQVLRYCNFQKIAVVPQGGNTSLCGGSVPVFDEVIINMQKMNKIIDFDQVSSILHCEAGCILQTLDEYVGTKGCTMPLDLGAKGSCQIGGNLSTNAGGIHYVQHGSLRSNCLGVKAVLANGTIIDNMLPLPKNNTGYDLKQLFIGSEGTLGIITESLITCPMKLAFKDVLLIGLNKFEDIVKVYAISREAIHKNLSAIEFFDLSCMSLAEKHTKNRSPIDKQYNYYILIESSSDEDVNKEILESLVERINQIGLDDYEGVISQDKTQCKKIWELREDLGVVTATEGVTLSYDFSLLLEDFYKLVERTRERLKGLPAVVTGFGHIGDYNLHLMVSYNKQVKDETFAKIENLMEPWIFEELGKFKGSVSAEHGIGLHKSPYLKLTQSVDSINLMKSIKDVLDPNGIMNPYKLF